MRGARWEEEREKRGLSLFSSSPWRFLYLDYGIAIFIGIHSGSICGGENSNMGGGTKCPSYRDSTERSKGKQGLTLLPCYICNKRPNLSPFFSVLSLVEMVSDGGPYCAAEEQINVILFPNRKPLRSATLVLALHGLQENGVR